MGRKRNKTEIWNKIKNEKRHIREHGGVANTNVFAIDPAEQKRAKLARRMARKLEEERIRRLPTKEELREKKQVKKRRTANKAFKRAVKSLKGHQLTTEELELMVAAKHRETKRERLRRLMFAKRAGLDVDDTELYSITATPSSIMDLKQIQDTNPDAANPSNPPNPKQKAKEWNFGNLSTESTVNSLVPGATDKAYAVDSKTWIVSTRKNRVRKKKTIVLMDVTKDEEEEEEQKVTESDDSDVIMSSNNNSDENDKTPISTNPNDKNDAKRSNKPSNQSSSWDNRRYRKGNRWGSGFGGMKSKSVMELQAFLECHSDDEVLIKFDLKPRTRKFTVPIKRGLRIQRQREQLPIIGEEYRIMECIRDHDVVLIAGETGSGKSTQIPQFLYEAGYSWMQSQDILEREGTKKSSKRNKFKTDGKSEINQITKVHGGWGMIGVTEPRRVAAMSVAQRVGVELNRKEHVSYQIRYDSQVTEDTHIKFMTDGILMREIQGDFLLNRYSVIILDEAHERNLNTDVLVGLLSRIVIQRRLLFERYLKDLKLKGLDRNDGKNEMEGMKRLSPLKLIIMSATLRVEDFNDNLHLFNPPPPLIKIKSRQHPVTVHFNKTTPLTDEEYEEDVFKKVCKIHVLLPKGHVLVFLTGRRQIEYMCQRLRNRFSKPTAKEMPKYKEDEPNDPQKDDDDDDGNKNEEGDKEQKIKCAEDLIMVDEEDEDHDMEDDFATTTTPVDNSKEPNKWEGLLKDWKEKSYSKVNILPLYSVLDPSKQAEVFNRQDPDVRLIVVATNIAETSITIPGIKYVVDSGRVKQQKYAAKENMSKMVVEFISKSSALQRAGRAGRTGPGHCYRLFSSNFYDQWMDDHFEPEILRVPIENIILQMKAMNIDSISHFPFPTPPPRDTILQGLRILQTLGALQYVDDDFCGHSVASKSLQLLRENERLRRDEKKLKITELGLSMIEYPISVRCSKMLISAQQGKCLPFVIAIVALLSVDNLQYGADEMDKMLKHKLKAMMEEEKKKKNHLKEQNKTNDDDEALKMLRNEKEKQRWMRKEKREMVIRARHQFANNKSDLLSFLNIFGAYLCSRGERERIEFCRQHFVRKKNISECHSLMTQLQNILQKVHSDELDIHLQPQPPSKVQQILLRQIIASGLVDQIARKWPHQHTPTDDDWSRSKKNYLLLKRAYQCMSWPSSPVFIHPTSYIYTSTKFEFYTNDMPYQPEFVVYFSLSKNETVSVAANEEEPEKRSYMRFVTVIEPHWLMEIAPHLCIHSEPLQIPQPFYDESEDCVKWTVEVRFGPHQWELPRQSVEITDKKKRYQWFARLLLEGEIFEDLKCIKPYLQHRTQTITESKYGAVTNFAVISIVEKLEEHDIDSKYKMKLSLLRDSDFLFAEMKLWVYSVKQKILRRAWPPSK